jgi:hypothetical protein
MPAKLELSLTPEERAELIPARDHHSKAYLREHCAAAQERLQHIVSRCSTHVDVQRSRWPLTDLVSVCTKWLTLTTPTGM